MSDTYKYDVGIICTEEDGNFADTLIEKVEDIFGKKVFYKPRDAGGGYKTDISLKMFTECERIFAIYSQHSNESTIYEGNLALQKYCKENKKSNRQRIVPLIIDTKGTCPEFLDVSEVIQFPDNKYFWDRIRKTLEEKLQLGETDAQPNSANANSGGDTLSNDNKGGQGDVVDGDVPPDGNPSEPLLERTQNNAEVPPSSGNDPQGGQGDGDDGDVPPDGNPREQMKIEEVPRNGQQERNSGWWMRIKNNRCLEKAIRLLLGALIIVTIILWISQIIVFAVYSCTSSLYKQTHINITIAYVITTGVGVVIYVFVVFCLDEGQKEKVVQLIGVVIGGLLVVFTPIALKGCYDNHDVREPTTAAPMIPIYNTTVNPFNLAISEN